MRDAMTPYGPGPAFFREVYGAVVPDGADHRPVAAHPAGRHLPARSATRRRLTSLAGRTGLPHAAQAVFRGPDEG